MVGYCFEYGLFLLGEAVMGSKPYCPTIRFRYDLFRDPYCFLPPWKGAFGSSFGDAPRYLSPWSAL